MRASVCRGAEWGGVAVTNQQCEELLHNGEEADDEVERADGHEEVMEIVGVKPGHREQLRCSTRVPV